MCLVRPLIGVAANDAGGFHRLDLGIPVQHHLVVLQARGRLVASRVRLLHRGDRTQFAEGVAELGAYAIDRFLQAP